MSVSLRLARIGKKQRPFYRIVAIDKRKARGGRYLEKLGDYDPLKTEQKMRINKTLVFKWFGYGAQPTQTVKQLFSAGGVLAEWDELKQAKRRSAASEAGETKAKKPRKLRKGRGRPMAAKLELRAKLAEQNKRTEAYQDKKRRAAVAAKAADEAKKTEEPPKPEKTNETKPIEKPAEVKATATANPSTDTPVVKAGEAAVAKETKPTGENATST